MEIPNQIAYFRKELKAAKLRLAIFEDSASRNRGNTFLIRQQVKSLKEVINGWEELLNLELERVDLASKSRQRT